MIENFLALGATNKTKNYLKNQLILVEDSGKKSFCSMHERSVNEELCEQEGNVVFWKDTGKRLNFSFKKIYGYPRKHIAQNEEIEGKIKVVDQVEKVLTEEVMKCIWLKEA
jgi:hypothetical protein